MRLLLVVGDVHEGGADPPLHRLELGLDLAAQRHVEGAQRLVEQQDGGLDHERPRQGDALPLPARELVDAAALEPVQAHQRQRLRDPAAARVAGDTRAWRGRSRCCPATERCGNRA